MPKPAKARGLTVPRWARRAGMSEEEYGRWLNTGREKSRSVKAVNATDLHLDMDKVPDEAEVFSGPRLSFSWLVGESPSWSGPESLWLYHDEGQRRCRFCAHLQAMPSHAYCLGCDRCGREHLLGAPRPRAGRKAYAPDPVLKGGCG